MDNLKQEKIKKKITYGTYLHSVGTVGTSGTNGTHCAQDYIREASEKKIPLRYLPTYSGYCWYQRYILYPLYMSFLPNFRNCSTHIFFFPVFRDYFFSRLIPPSAARWPVSRGLLSPPCLIGVRSVASGGPGGSGGSRAFPLSASGASVTMERSLV